MILAGPSDFVTGDLTDWVLRVIDALGYLGVGLLVAIENVFPPIPSEVVLPAAGIHANDGQSNVVLMIVAATVGSVLGAWVLYAVAAAIGPDRLRAALVGRARWLGIKPADLDRAEAWFDRRDDLAVLVCRGIPLVRSLVSIPAGFRRMDPWRFTIFTTIGSLVWNAALILVGYAARDRWEQVQDVLGYAQYVVVAAILAVLARWLWRRLLAPTSATGAPEPEG